MRIIRFFVQHLKYDKRLSLILLLNILVVITAWYLCLSTNSMALVAYSYVSVFNIMRLFCCFISNWVQTKHANFSYSFGYERFEVLSVFVCTTLTQLGAFFILKESFEGFIHENHHIKTDMQMAVVITGYLLNMLVTYCVKNKSFATLSREAPSNMIQDFLFDVGRGFCTRVPSLSRMLLFRSNPFILLTNISSIIIIAEIVLIDFKEKYVADTLGAVLITALIIVTMYPLSVHSGMILLQTNPKEIRSSIDKCLKEASTLDGLLEFRQEHVWTISFGKFAGVFHVRARRDANEQLLLAQLTNTFSPYLHHITIQISKDDWAKPSIYSTPSMVRPPPFSTMEFQSTADKNGWAIPAAYTTSSSLNRPPPSLNRHTPSVNRSMQFKSSGLYQQPEKSKRTSGENSSLKKYEGPKIMIDFD